MWIERSEFARYLFRWCRRVRQDICAARTARAFPAQLSVCRWQWAMGQYGSASFAGGSPRLSLLPHHLRTVLAFAAPNNGAPLTAPGRSERRFLIREKGFLLNG